MRKLEIILAKIKSIKAETWIAIFSLILSIYAVKSSEKQFLTNTEMNIKQLELTKRHNMLSVKPILNINYYIDQNLSKIGFELCNKGLGPATVINQQVFLADYKFENFEDLSTALSRSNEGFWIDRMPSCVNLTSLTINPGESFYIYWIDKNNVLDYQKAEKILIKNVKINIDYKDVYGNIYTVYYHNKGERSPLQLKPVYRLSHK